MNRKRIIVITAAAAALLIIAGIVWAVIGRPATSEGSNGSTLTASGFIEAEQVTVAPELGGRVVELLATEGEQVEAGQVLARLDPTLLDAQIEMAQAALDQAQAQLDQATSGARPEQIRQADAALAQAEAARDGAYQAWQDLIAMRDDPQELNAQIALARAQVTAAEAALAQAAALKDAAEIAHDAYVDAQEDLSQIPVQFQPGMPMSFHLIPNAYWKSWVGVNAAQAELDGARAALDNLIAMRDDPQELNGQIDAAETQHRAAEAAVQMAQAQVDGLRAGATDQEIALAQAQVDQAQAALDALQVLRDKQTIVAPVSGLVLECTIHQGELAVPGAPLLTLGDLDQVTLTVYVPQDRLGQIFTGQQVEVRVDSFPDRTFAGTVVAIANEAEFTPRNVQTEEERVNMVFATDVRIPNPDHALKPGLPADASIIIEEQ